MIESETVRIVTRDVGPAGGQNVSRPAQPTKHVGDGARGEYEMAVDNIIMTAAHLSGGEHGPTKDVCAHFMGMTDFPLTSE